MRHLKAKKKLNMKPDHRRSFLRNQAIHIIKYGHLTTTLTRVKEVRKLVEKVVTIAAKQNDFNGRRRVLALLPYDQAAVKKLFTEIAPQYVDRPGGYTRIYKLGQRPSDTAKIARLQWV